MSDNGLVNRLAREDEQDGIRTDCEIDAFAFNTEARDLSAVLTGG